MADDQHYDVVIIGTGAGGGTRGHRLATKGALAGVRAVPATGARQLADPGSVRKGTVRFGTDPAASALDVNWKAHDVDNLYVVDTSVFPSIGAVNPSLTAIANALRVGDHITQRLG